MKTRVGENMRKPSPSQTAASNKPCSRWLRALGFIPWALPPPVVTSISPRSPPLTPLTQPLSPASHLPSPLALPTLLPAKKLPNTTLLTRYVDDVKMMWMVVKIVVSFWVP